MSTKLVLLARKLEHADREVNRAIERRNEIAADLQSAVSPNGATAVAKSSGHAPVRQNSLKSRILKILAGSKGIATAEIGKKTGANKSSLYGAIYLLNKSKKIQRVGPSTYKLSK